MSERGKWVRCPPCAARNCPGCLGRDAGCCCWSCHRHEITADARKHYGGSALVRELLNLQLQWERIGRARLKARVFRCAECGCDVAGVRTGRPKRWCSPGCRQANYRRRKRLEAEAAVPDGKAAELDAKVFGSRVTKPLPRPPAGQDEARYRSALAWLAGDA